VLVGGLQQQAGHALEVVLDAVVHFLDQHLALRNGRLQTSLLGGALLWLAKQGLDTLNRLDAKVTKISHELFGPEGTNGMRSEVRDSTRMLHAHTKVIAILADREGIDFDAETR
jgi:hypothetical protein